MFTILQPFHRLYTIHYTIKKPLIPISRHNHPVHLSITILPIPVESAACQMCSRHLDSPRQARLTLAQGYIASWITKQYDGCGSASCPWLIEVQPGQKINITLYDFSDKSKPITNTWIPNTCNRFGVIKETAAPTDKPICKGQKRERHLYTSVSNSLEIHVVSPEVLDKAGQFLLYYEGRTVCVCVCVCV